MKNKILLLALMFTAFAHADNPPWIGNTIWLELVEGTRIDVPFKRFLQEETTPVQSWRTEQAMGFPNPGVTFSADAMGGTVKIPPASDTLPYQYRFYLHASIGGADKMVWVFLNIRPAHDLRVRWHGYVSAKTPDEPVSTFITGAVGEKKSFDLHTFVYNPMGSGLHFKKLEGPAFLAVSPTGALETYGPFTADQADMHTLKIRVSDLMSEDILRLQIIVH